MTYLGDFAEDAMVDFKWSSNSAAGASITRATDGTISVYVGNSTTQLTTGVTDTEDFDSVTGVHHCRIDLSSSATYAVGSECQVVLSGATIDGATVNAVLATFSIERAGGVLAVLKGLLESSSDGNIFKAVSLQNVDAPVREAVGLATANLDTQLSALQSDTNDIQTRLPAALVSGRMDSSTGAMAANVLTAAATAADFTTEIQSGLATAAALDTVDNFLDTEIADIQARLPAALVGGRIDASVGAMAANVMTAAAAAADLTTELQTGLATAAALATMQGNVTDILADTAVIGAPAGASLSADVAAVKSDSAAILADTGTDGVVVATASKTGYQLSATGVDDILDEVVEGAVTLRQSVRLANSALGGKASGLATTEATFRDLADTKDRLVATVDADGNRSAVTRDLT